MSNATANVSEYDTIAKVVQHYIDGARSGKGDDMKPRLPQGCDDLWLCRC